MEKKERKNIKVDDLNEVNGGLLIPIKSIPGEKLPTPEDPNDKNLPTMDQEAIR